MHVLLSIFKIHLKIIYFFIKLFTKKRKRIFFLSRQTNKPSLNYILLIDYIKKEEPNLEIKVSCLRVSEGLNKILHVNTKTVWKLIPSLLKDFGSCIKYYFTLYKQMYYIATSKVIVVDGYNILVSCLNHKKNTCVIQMWHALAAIKKFGFQTIGHKDGMDPKTAQILNMHANYDYILSGSVAMNKPFSEAFNTDINKVLAIGTPYIDYLSNHKVNKKDIFNKCKELDKNKPIIVYSPTFRKDGRNSIKEVIENIDQNKYNLIVKLHKLDAEKININEFKDIIINPKIDTPSLLKVADYVITDYSAIMIEAAILKTNILLYVYDYEEYERENGLNVNLFEELPGYTSKNIKDLIKVIDKNNYDKKILLNFRKKFVINSKDCTKKVYELIKGEL